MSALRLYGTFNDSQRIQFIPLRQLISNGEWAAVSCDHRVELMMLNARSHHHGNGMYMSLAATAEEDAAQQQWTEGCH